MTLNELGKFLKACWEKGNYNEIESLSAIKGVVVNSTNVNRF